MQSNNLIIILSGLLFSISLTVIATDFIRKNVKKFILQKRKEELGRNQEKFVSRVGGIAIYLSFFITYFLLTNFFQLEKDFDSAANLPYKSIILGSSSIFLIGIIDDFIYLSPYLRLFLQFLTSILAWNYGLRFGNLDLSIFGIENFDIVFPTLLRSDEV